MKILDAKAAHDRKWEELEQFPASSVTKFKNKKEVIEHAQKGKTVPFATLMDLKPPQESGANVPNIQRVRRNPR